MRVLIAAFAHTSHFHGFVPLAGALRAAGHDVRVASQPAFADEITAAGLTAVPVGEDHRLLEAMVEKGAEIQKYSADIDLSQPEVIDWDYLFNLYDLSVPYFYSVINDESFVRGLVTYARQWQPDLVLWEPYTFAGAIAARACGAAHARVLSASDLNAHFRQEFVRLLGERPAGQRPDPLRDWLAGAAESHGVAYDEELVVGQWSVDTLPARFRLDLSLPTVGVRYLPYNGRAVVPDWLREPATRRRVCLTTGSTGSSFTTDPEVLHRYLRVLAEVDAELVVTADSAALAEVGPLPQNVRVVDFAPLDVLLEDCAAVVHHGGYGTWSTALYHGVPQIVVPFLWDTVLRAQQTAAAGAGLHLKEGEVSAEDLRDSVARVLADASFLDRARALRDETRAEPSPQAVVAALEERVAAR
ncbi:activator-dependent family glycosyltransferase [Streptomyces sp. SID14478]|uniref:activator-dependent family glycosyltransferase n=1 Tax=Streptomyces sp. SID14478 TaxID=2706073 RepID=UPI0013DF602D|nr:activator-dependent family glycosyltransferase [Streptomyces sp. SID14478]NEB81461.1 activator-dependent family glycosyltransferase [Streptomyces sp. SID14478]